jgi:hypothetical protein
MELMYFGPLRLTDLTFGPHLALLTNSRKLAVTRWYSDLGRGGCDIVEPSRGSNRPKEPRPSWAATSHIYV